VIKDNDIFQNVLAGLYIDDESSPEVCSPPLPISPRSSEAAFVAQRFVCARLCRAAPLRR
jgi:hypothetical protein